MATLILGLALGAALVLVVPRLRLPRRRRLPLCDWCDKPIQGRAVTVLGEVHHHQSTGGWSATRGDYHRRCAAAAGVQQPSTSRRSSAASM